MCQVHDDKAACSCHPGMRGIPPNCRPECVINQDCPSTRACISGKCLDSCISACGQNAICQVINHDPICSCYENHEGDPYSGCILRSGEFHFLIKYSFFLGNDPICKFFMQLYVFLYFFYGITYIYLIIFMAK